MAYNFVSFSNGNWSNISNLLQETSPQNGKSKSSKRRGKLKIIAKDSNQHSAFI